VLRLLGAGGMGNVYQVRHVISNHIEAMKVLLPGLTNEPKLIDRFLREIRISASLEQPRIQRCEVGPWLKVSAEEMPLPAYCSELVVP
jgi:serine/threonine-protein kinase